MNFESEKKNEQAQQDCTLEERSEVMRAPEFDEFNQEPPVKKIVNTSELIDQSLLDSTDVNESSESECSSSDSDGDESSDNEISAEEVIDTVLHLSILGYALRKWALKSNTTDDNLTSLLKILNPYHPDLPISSKTLLKSDPKLCSLIRKFNPEDPSDNSEYVYIGIARYLQRIVNIGLHKIKTLRLQFNIDGLPIFKSSSLEFWPILCRIFTIGHFYYEPFVVALWSGIGKPKSMEKYFDQFIQELNDLLLNGIVIKGEKFAVEVMCFICDRPAKSLIKCIKNHGGYWACERCSIKGVSHSNRIVYPEVDEDRTDESFRSQTNPQHHSGISPLTKIKPSINMIYGFVLDVMHLIFLGVIKKIVVEYWIEGGVMLKENALRLSHRLINMSSKIPAEFQRTTRSLVEILKYKATEWRILLCYTGPFVLKDLLPDSVYRQFLLLSISCRILSSEEYRQKYLEVAEAYLKQFVLLMEKLYGKVSLVLNVHSLLHIVQDVKYMACSIMKIAAFPFESKLGFLKRLIKHGKKPLAQVCKKLEQEFETEDEYVKILEIKVLKCKKLKDILQIQRLQFYGVELTVKEPNNTVLLNDRSVVQIEKMYSSSDKIEDVSEKNVRLFGKVIEKIGAALEYPPNVEVLDMYKVNLSKKEEELQLEFTLKDIKSKMMLIKVFELSEDEKTCYVVPLLHNF